MICPSKCIKFHGKYFLWMNLPMDKFVLACELGLESLNFISALRVSPEEVATCDTLESLLN